MKVGCIVPVHNFSEGALRIAHWLFREIVPGVERKVFFINDCSNIEHAVNLEKVRSAGFYLVDSIGKNSLKDALITGLNSLEDWCDVIHIIESDAVPDSSTMSAMFKVYRESDHSKLASVSPIYTWMNRNCYPTHPHWFTDKLVHKKYSTGEVRSPGAAGVPFLFSLWTPQAIEMIRDETLPPVMGLDSSLGGKCHRAGLEHLRLTNFSVDHWGGGKQSR